MSSTKSEKELAFLYDLYVAPDWGERFAELIDKNITLPKEGTILYLGAGTGGHALAIRERGGDKIKLVGLDESEERLDLARAKAGTAKMPLEFVRQQPEALDFDDDYFDLVIGDASLIEADRLPEIFEELTRVAADGATIALNVATASSFGEFFSVYWEALQNSRIQNHEHDVESLITELPTASEVEEIARESGLEDIRSWTTNEEFDYASGREFLESPLIADFLLPRWMESIPSAEDRARVVEEIVRIIEEERSDMAFALTVKATLVAGRKAV
jgi:ubiquinone/menaquinone biosynthesis C-methylase UbiE